MSLVTKLPKTKLWWKHPNYRRELEVVELIMVGETPPCKVDCQIPLLHSRSEALDKYQENKITNCENQELLGLDIHENSWTKMESG
jgi:hypothetical protein